MATTTTSSASASMARCSAVGPTAKPSISAQTLPKRPAKTPKLSAAIAGSAAEQASPNQICHVRGAMAGLGLAAASGLAGTPHAAAIGDIAEAAANDNRGQLLLIVVAPAILWVLYNILQPALNQINKMRSK